MARKIEPPYMRGLVELHHRLAAWQLEQNRVELELVHRATACLPEVAAQGLQGGSGQAEPPESDISEGSSTASVKGASWSETA